MSNYKAIVKMKILWYANTPCGSVRRNKSKSYCGGWMISLEDEVKKSPEVELHVAYFSATEKEPFAFDGVTYHPCSSPKLKTHWLEFWIGRSRFQAQTAKCFL